MRYLSDLALRLTPYVPGEQPQGTGLIKLNTNENPYPPSPRAVDAMQAAIGDQLRLYSPPECIALREAIARVEGLPGPEYVYAFNGSDEALSFAFGAFFTPGKQVCFPDITYSFYPVYCDFYNLDYRTVPLRDDMQIDVEQMQAEGGVALPNPNAPTGLGLTRDEIIYILQANAGRIVIVDEAYAAFYDGGCADLIPQYENLLITRTFSKAYSLAGLRAGYVLGQPHLIDGICRLKNSFNSYTLDAVAQAGALAAVQDTDYYARINGQVIATRERVRKAVLEMGMDCLPSGSNFLFMKHPVIDGKLLFHGLRKRNILVRRFDHPERISQYLRVSIGTDAQMDIVLQAMEDLIGEHTK